MIKSDNLKYKGFATERKDIAMDLKKSFFLKSICYIMIPILIVILCISIFYITYSAENIEELTKESYYDTSPFSWNYYTEILNQIQGVQGELSIERTYIEETELENMGQTENEYTAVERYNSYIDTEDSFVFTKVEIGENTIYFQENSNSFIDYLIIDLERGFAYTNMAYTQENNSIEKIKNNIEKNIKYWSFEKDDNKITSNIENIDGNHINQSRILYRWLTEKR